MSPIRRNAYGTPDPPVTWRESVPGIQADWRYGYGVGRSGGLVLSMLDAIPRQRKTIPHYQYRAVALSLARAPDALSDAIGWVSARSSALGCNDANYLALQSGASAYTFLHCIRLTAIAGNPTLQFTAQSPLPPTFIQAARFNGGSGGWFFQRVVPASGVSTLPAVAIGVGATVTIGWTYDGAGNGAFYVNGAAVGASAAMLGAQNTLDMEAWGAVLGAAQGMDAQQYERMFCVGALAAPDMLAASNQMLAEYPP